MKIDQALLDEVIIIAKKAGRAILDIYHSKACLDIRTKHDNSPVTFADLTAHEIIATGLTALAPDIPVLSEEDPDVAFEIRKKWHTFWLVDPLDGTKEFIHRSGQFTVNIALIENSIPILGVIYVPMKDELYFAGKGLGSFKENQAGLLILKARQWQIDDKVVLVATRRELHEEIREKLTAYAEVKITYRSSSLKFCLLAEGLADIYLRKKPIHEWDTAAGQCILEQAGGVVLDSNWEPLRYNTKPDLLNPPFIALGDSKQLLPILKMMPMF